jgi:hypothetical protein
VHFPTGPDGAHGLSNETDAPVRYVMASTLRSPEVAEYPDIKKITAQARTARGAVAQLRGTPLKAEVHHAMKAIASRTRRVDEAIPRPSRGRVSPPGDPVNRGRIRRCLIETVEPDSQR